MSVYVSEQLRKAVTQRAKHLCEYCLFHEEDALNTFHIEHILTFADLANKQIKIKDLASEEPIYYSYF